MKDQPPPIPDLPGKLTLWAFRLPIWLYRFRLGWLLGQRFLMIEHIGRKSGLPKKTVLEVLRHDKPSDTYYILSGWGKKADWFQNVSKTPEVTVHVGFRRFKTVPNRCPSRLLNASCSVMPAGIHSR